MTARIVLVHGIRSNGVRSVYRLDAWLSGLGYEVVRAKLPIRRLWSVRWNYAKDAAMLATIVRDDDVIVGHSYGAALTVAVAKERLLRAVFLFNAALDDDVDLSVMRGRPQTYNMYSRNDRVVWWAGLLPKHFFGRAGNHGFHDLSEQYNLEIGGGHSDAFVGQGAERWADFIHTQLLSMSA